MRAGSQNQRDNTNRRRVLGIFGTRRHKQITSQRNGRVMLRRVFRLRWVVAGQLLLGFAEDFQHG
jgi:hypothetical protein